MRKTLTDRGVKMAKAPETGRVEINDNIIPALALRLNSTGERRYVVRTRINGTQVRKTLGDPAVISLEEARDLASEVLRHAKRGIDILEQRKDEATAAAAAQAAANSNTVTAVAELFFADIGAIMPGTRQPAETPTRRGRKAKQIKTAPEVRRTIETLLFPKFGDRPIGSVTRRELIAHFDTVVDHNGPVAANR